MRRNLATNISEALSLTEKAAIRYANRFSSSKCEELLYALEAVEERLRAVWQELDEAEGR